MFFSSWAAATVWSIACLCITTAHGNLPPLRPSLPSGKVYIVIKEGPEGEFSPASLRAQGGLSHVRLASTSQQRQDRNLGTVHNLVPPCIWSEELEPVLVSGLTNERDARIRAMSEIGLFPRNKKQRYWMFEVATAPHVLTLEPESAGPGAWQRRVHFALGGIPWSQVRQFTMLSANTLAMASIGERLVEAEDDEDEAAQKAAEHDAEHLGLNWMANSDYDKRWESTSLGATPVPGNIFQGQPLERARDLMRTLTSRQRIPNEQHRQTLQQLLDWNTDTEPLRNFPLLRTSQPLRLEVSALRQINWGAVEIPPSLQVALASGLASAAECSSAIVFFRDSLRPPRSSKRKREEEACSQLVNLVRGSDNIPRQCHKIRGIEVEMGLADGIGDGTFDSVGGTIEGPAGKAEFFFADDPASGTRRVMKIDMNKYFGRDEVDLAGIDKITLNAKGDFWTLMPIHNDQFVIQDVAIRATCSDANFRAQNNQYVGIHRTYQHPGQESFFELTGVYKEKTVGTLKINPSQWSFTPPCSYIKDLRYEFHMGPSIGDGTWDGVFFKLGQSKRVDLGRNVDAGATIAGEVDLQKTFEKSAVDVRALQKLTLWDDVANNWFEKADKWKFQGMTFTATCAAVPKRVTMRKFASEGEIVQHRDNNAPVWSGEIAPKDWQEVA